MDLSEFDNRCIAILESAPKRQSRHCFRSAFQHLRLAKSILDIDPGMAVFRGITAEEEAASGLMHCLKEIGYKNADKLKTRDHVHKSAIVPFFLIIGAFFDETISASGIKPHMHIQAKDGIDRLTIALPTTVNGQLHNAYPIPPLNFAVTSGEQRPSYRQQIDRFVKKTGSTNIETYIKEQANARNKVLYAGPNGYPSISNITPSFLAGRQARVISLLRAFLFIYPYRELQPFVQDALDAFLAMLGTLKEHDLHAEV